MGDGIFAELEVGGPASCRLPTKGTETAATINSITRSTIPTEDEAITEEFTVEQVNGRTRDDSDDTALDEIRSMTRVFDTDSETVYRFDRERRGCVCDRVEALGCPVRDVTVNGDQVTVTFFAIDIETLQTVIRDLKDRFETVSVRRLLRSDADEAESDLMFIDRSMFTDRQREVLTVAHDMGYFAHPREANAETVAGALDITVSTFAEHLAAAQSKLMDSVLTRS
ncbi:helix-turn-helix domain-containing protein [Halococcus saccharolyticus]|uniref:Bacterio-opsin activator HTH domain-containing protein n=1 Tax=Halococcus saccharolyticus DSM 5350 TaxID=1227455 RepID=M0MK66_9EURY|nr:helix-turn-helix domain-containing protein [Halococcus saccharolyticus]EMA46041.1 bacterio-opsin activator HTH domain-containing protein [Halococcus saccharolyticus DSM 5350]